MPELVRDNADKFVMPAFSEIAGLVDQSKADDVRKALGKERLDVYDLAALLSPAAAEYLPELASRSAELTAMRFGRTIQIYAPLYLSSYCANGCAYCGFSVGNKIERRVLSLDEAEGEAKILAGRGFSHILLVSGEAPGKMGVDYLEELAGRLKDSFAAISIEVQPLDEDDYRVLTFEAADLFIEKFGGL